MRHDARNTARVTAVSTTLAFLCGFVFAAGQAKKVATIARLDLEVAGIPQAATTDDVKRALGPPRKVVDWPEPSGGATWTYADLEFTFDAEGRRQMAVLNGPSRATRKGLRVGQGAKRALTLYGEPYFQDEGHILWTVDDDPEGTLGMTVLVAKGVVTRILLGEVIEY